MTGHVSVSIHHIVVRCLGGLHTLVLRVLFKTSPDFKTRSNSKQPISLTGEKVRMARLGLRISFPVCDESSVMFSGYTLRGGVGLDMAGNCWVDVVDVEVERELMVPAMVEWNIIAAWRLSKDKCGG